MIAKIAVSAAVFAIDKPYSYAVPPGMELRPGQRVTVPFGRSNKLTEGMVLEEPAKAARALAESLLYGYASYNYYYPKVL